ncbi:uncharacterized protein LOC101899651 [Musca domestica]|uniref:Uncharacterized protein LOC101899651 n=1 Tax=Musca domestica TaxID=7370 RepID=A0A1I8M2A3_MUSDO|nr:uncharacterized protein LOC101899651 [Musca domestica]
MNRFEHLPIGLRFLLISLILCNAAVQNTAAKHEEHLETENTSSEQKRPVTSYYRHNIYGPNTYAFGFEVHDKVTGNIQFRDEKRFGNGSIKGSYGYVKPDGSVTVTHFMADKDQGYSSQTENFEPGEQEKWADNWPTKKPNILMEKPPESVQPEVRYDEKEKLNLTSVLLPVEPIKAEHGIDLNPEKLEKAIVNPAVLEVINGETPLLANDKKKSPGIGFATFNEFIPPEFPKAPFELPLNTIGNKEDPKKKEESNDNAETKNNNKYDERKINNSEKVLNAPDLGPSSTDKYVKSKENNAEKSLPPETLRISEDSENDGKFYGAAKGRSLKFENSADWYDRIISQNRKEYLEDLE